MESLASIGICGQHVGRFGSTRIAAHDSVAHECCKHACTSSSGSKPADFNQFDCRQKTKSPYSAGFSRRFVLNNLTNKGLSRFVLRGNALARSQRAASGDQVGDILRGHGLTRERAFADKELLSIHADEVITRQIGGCACSILSALGNIVQPGVEWRQGKTGKSWINRHVQYPVHQEVINL
jgi:hypothetical protein